MLKADVNSIRLKKNTLTRHSYCLPVGNQSLALGQQTKIMGVLNLTPDSFSGDGCLRQIRNDTNFAVNRAQKLIKEGADIIDIGGESSRPGAGRIPVQEELDRIIPTIRHLRKKTQTLISVDTYKTTVARQALDEGANIVNNIMGVKNDTNFLKTVRNYDAAIILMHIRGTSRTMQRNTHYSNLIGDIIESLEKSVEKCLEIGIKSDKIIIDPGIGFGKTAEQNLQIINRLKDFQKLKKPLLIGTSRKSFIGQILNKDAQHRLIGTIATLCTSIMNGAHIIRVHDVKEAKEAALITDAILNESDNAGENQFSLTMNKAALN